LKFITSEQAAERLFVTTYTVRKYVREGKLRASKPGKHFLIEEESVSDLLKRMTYKSPMGG
jgi:excisionase family DNA binding protein